MVSPAPIRWSGIIAMCCAGGFTPRRTTLRESTPDASCSASEYQRTSPKLWSKSMSVEFIGYIGSNYSSETVVRNGGILDRYYIETVAKAHENAGFDRALLAFHSTTPDGLQIGQHVLGVTDKLNVLI